MDPFIILSFILVLIGMIRLFIHFKYQQNFLLKDKSRLEKIIEDMSKKEQEIISVNEDNKKRNNELRKEENDLLSKISTIKQQIQQELNNSQQNLENQKSILIQSLSNSYES